MLIMTEVAAEKVKAIMKSEGTPADHGLRVRVMGGGCSGFQYQLAFDSAKEGDEIVEQNGVKLMVDPKSLLYLVGTEVDFADGLSGSGFTLKNPNTKGTCGCGQSFQA
ncbi:MAG: iron-sulfur cluster insertion protein ErpA [Candidatus Methylomirabilales bacterium]